MLTKIESDYYTPDRVVEKMRSEDRMILGVPWDIIEKEISADARAAVIADIRAVAEKHRADYPIEGPFSHVRAKCFEAVADWLENEGRK